jgi:hypothetical protein
MMQNRMKVLAGGLMALVSVAAVGCGGGGGGGGVIIGGGDPIVQAWYDVYGYRCGSGLPKPGCNFFADGAKIVDVEDPYFDTGYYLEKGTWYYVDSYGYERSYYGWAWLSDTGILYDEFGYALNESNGSAGRDLIAKAAEQEEAMIQAVGKDFASKYALAEDKGVQIARTLSDWATLGKKRARTDADLADFTQRLYGISVEQAKTALESAKSGDLSALEGLNKEVASNWGTSPETSKEILKAWYKDEINAATQQ